ncbi:fluoride efflux transporter CrcB [Bacillus sp. T3]|uniref:fluoride efflux transporter CrcB n=1 Tax=Bacillus sp. T3 TaxID=467262 RepID=UPI002981971E|nr:fluoride efflux transporter CrcB [Bacillus sp. T3]
MIWLIGFGGSLGAATRYLLGGYINNKNSKWSPFPLGTWIINITGSFILGLLAHLYQNYSINEALWLFAGVGFCGAYTTFSTFGYETITLIHNQKIKLAVFYVAVSVIIGIMSAWLGYILI